MKNLITRSLTPLMVFLLLGAFKYGQAQITAGPGQSICVPNCATLNATYTQTFSTSSYSVASIPYAPDPFNVGTALTWQSNGDDEVHGPYNIGFDFCFMGFTRQQFYIGINGWVGFSNGPTTFTSASIPNMAGTVPKDCIMGPWQDWYPGFNNVGQVRYQVLGTAPFRRLVVSWNTSPLFSCTALTGTFQIVLFETTNIVETRIQNKPGPCAWAGGTAVHGIHNLFGTVAYTVPGRNSTQWVATNDAWRFSPNGPPDFNFGWYNGATLVSTSPTPSVCPTTTTTYTAQITYNCTNLTYTSQTTITVGVAPANAGNNSSICTGGNVQLNGTGGVSFSWSPASGLSCTTCPNPIASPSATTTYTLTVTDASGCTGTSSVTVTVLPPPVASAGSNTSICTGGSTVLNGSGGTSYVWSPGTGLSSTTVSNPTASPTATTTYTVTVSNGACTNTSSVTITVNALPVASAGSPASICNGNNTQLSGSGGGTYAWTPSASLNSGTISNPVASPTSTTTYTLVVTDANGCSASSTVTVTVNSASATASASNNNICQGDTTQLSSTGGGSYSWSPATSLSTTTVSNPLAFPTVTTTYTVTVTAANGCTATATTTVVINIPPNATAGPDTAFCAGGNVQLNATGGTSYNWSPATGLSSTTIGNPVASPTSTTTYTVVITTGVCSVTDLITVTVNQNPIATAGSPVSICSNGPGTQLAGGGGTTYNWSPSTGLSSTTISNPIANPTATTTYTVVVGNAAGCTSTAMVTISVNPPPVASAGNNASVCAGGNTALNASGGVSYSWSPASGLSSTTISNPVATPSATTTYTVTVTDANGCTATSTVTVTVNAAFTLSSPTSIDQTCGNNDGQATAGTPSSGSSPFTYAWNNGQTGATATGLSSGNYAVTVTDANGCTSSQVVSVNQVIGANAAASANPPTGLYPLPVNFTNNSSGANNYIWNFGDGSPLSNAQNPNHTYQNPGTYTVTLIVYNNSPNCADTIYLTIVVFENISVVIPNVFTPNGDNMNDFLELEISGLKSATISIFNRWGTLIKTFDPISGKWDGRVDGGGDAVDGTYYYVFTGTKFDDTVMQEKGFISILRNK